VLAGLAFGVRYLLSQQQSKEARIAGEWLNPWVEALKSENPSQAWENLTTEDYRKNTPREAWEQTYQSALKAWGKPTRVSIYSAQGAGEIGSGRRYERTITDWTFERGQTLMLTFELVDVPQKGYRLDAARLGGRKSYIAPADAPNGPW